MAEETAYFNYILSKCSRARVSGALPQAFKDVEELISAYNNSYAHINSGYFGNHQLVEVLNEVLMNENVPNEHLLDNDRT